MIQIRKRGAAGGLYFRIRTAFRGRAGSSRTISVVAVAGSIGCDMVATSDGVASAAIGLSPASGGAPGFAAGALLLDAFVLLLGRRGCSVPERLLGITLPPSPPPPGQHRRAGKLYHSPLLLAPVANRRLGEIHSASAAARRDAGARPLVVRPCASATARWRVHRAQRRCWSPPTRQCQN